MQKYSVTLYFFFSKEDRTQNAGVAESRHAQCPVRQGLSETLTMESVQYQCPSTGATDGTGFAITGIMSNQSPSSFPSTQRDISNLKQTATDAASDIGNIVADHASQAKGQFRDLAGHVQEEGADKLDQVKGQLCTVLSAARDYASDRPFACIGVALAIGFLFGLTRRPVSRT